MDEALSSAFLGARWIVPRASWQSEVSCVLSASFKSRLHSFLFCWLALRLLILNYCDGYDEITSTMVTEGIEENVQLSLAFN